MAWNLSTVMDGIASYAAAQGVTARAYGYPIPNPAVPCMIVGYPTKLDFDMTMGRGSDELLFPLWFVVGKVVDKAARDALSGIITGVAGIKAAMDGNCGGAISTGRIEDCKIEILELGGIPYLAARFDFDVVAS